MEPSGAVAARPYLPTYRPCVGRGGYGSVYEYFFLELLWVGRDAVGACQKHLLWSPMTYVWLRVVLVMLH